MSAPTPVTALLPPRSDVLLAARSALEASLTTHGLDAPTVVSICDEACPLIGTAIEQAEKYKRGDITARRAALASTTADTVADLVADKPIDNIDDVVVSIAEIVGLALDAAFDAGPIEDRDGQLATKGLISLWRFIHELGSRDPGNLEALAQRAEKSGHPKRAARLRRAAVRIRARG